MARIFVKRGTRSDLDAAAIGGGLAEGEPYYVTDEQRIAVGTGTHGYRAAAMESDAGVNIDGGRPDSVYTAQQIIDGGAP